MLIYGLPLVALVLTFGGCQREDSAQPPKHAATASNGSYERDTSSLPRATSRWMYK